MVDVIQRTDDGWTVVDVNPGHVFRGVLLRNIEQGKSGDVYIYRFSDQNHIKGIVFPNNDILDVNSSYDLILNKIINRPAIETKRQGYLFLSEAYHEPHNVNDELRVRVSSISDYGHPMFKIYGHLGFIKCGERNTHIPKIGDKTRLVVTRAKMGKNCRILETRLLENL